ncbi:putative choloylglycine hydrolase [Limihaloglobus sulfuriphilus]|uniref:Putative choloylglycine hydrolase n=1 Tax=Limihaloglobus sulfuriphilus TaxID=1851148 RepID=A0A1Q2MFI2_9BACT|nr:C45 family peptidase [Limihaloglobus sulfuriphilus]AQQ71047.1 putative choloylglycine hydrolase [Limihaloglobus sulfuriphilus]
MKIVRLSLTLFLIVSFVAAAVDRKLIAECGKGYLETVDGYPVLHLKGTPQEMGTQHGTLLKEHIRRNIQYLLHGREDIKLDFCGIKLTPMMIAAGINEIFSDKIPPDYIAEMKTLAKAADVPELEVFATNLIPELFHCSGFALLKDAGSTGRLYHGRVLDYGVDWKLQDHAVLIIAEPEGKIPFVNVSYAGFIGSVTGMNTEQISIGEMGGGGVGMWNGIPMSFLVRMVLEQAGSLEQAVSVFTDNPRTCEYYYVIADARADDAAGLWCLPEKVERVNPGSFHELLPEPVENTVLLSSGKRYANLARLVRENYGKFDEHAAIRLMDHPVAMKSNLHNALMIPQDGVIYVANADKDGSPAWQQKYYRFDMNELIENRP